MARPPIDWKKKCLQLEGELSAQTTEISRLSRSNFELSFSQSNFKDDAEKQKEKNIKLYGIIEYLEDHIHKQNEIIEQLRGEKHERT